MITGAGGFVGRHLAERLVQAGVPVIASDLRDPGISGARFVACDIRDRAACDRLVQSASTVYHVASMVQTKQSGSEPIWAVNHGGTRNMLAASQAHGIQRFVYVSSASVVYQGKDIENGDESLPYAAASQAPYADSKIAAERDVLAAHDPSGLVTCAIRPHVIYGPGDGRFLPAILRRAQSGTLRFGVGRENKLSDFTYIDNLIDSLVLANQRLLDDPTLGGRAWFVTNGEPMGFWDFVDRVLVAMNLPKIKGRIPYSIAYALAALAEHTNSLLGRDAGPENGFTRFAVRYMCTHHYFSIENARRDLGYQPAVNIDEGIRRTIAKLASS
ncbi:MAG: NAD-dependent epimerase/dehydratase family protein [Myxococcales bacterium]|nr:NAD-dependent epimerase/dehydratase family protein [Myxococcales bacterium]